MRSPLRALENEDRKRSRAYPVLDLGIACDLIRSKLLILGDQKLSREALAAVLGYTSAAGGAAARKIGALVQFGFLDRHAGLYELSRRGHLLQSLKPDNSEFFAKVQEALERPVLFQRILDRYRDTGQLPDDLARVLARDFDITARASEDAASVFFRSARFARILDPDGTFRDSSPAKPARSSKLPPSGSATEHGEPPPMIYSLSRGKSAQLVFPPGMTVQDLQTLVDRLHYDLDHDKIGEFLGLQLGEGRVLDGSRLSSKRKGP